MSTRPSISPGADGAYGFALRGLDGARSLLSEAPPQWPAFDVAVETTGDPGPGEDRAWADRVQLSLRTGGWVEIRPHGAVFHLARRPEAGALVHPYLAPAAAIAARWLDRDSFHAGAVAIAGGAWALIGDKGSGKSSVLAHLLDAGHGVITDDLLIVEDGQAFAGPRCLDLREEPATRLGIGVPLGVIGDRERWRVETGPVAAPQLPLRGWVMLGWGDRTEVEPARGPQRLATIDAHRAVRLEPRDPVGLLALSSLPVLQLRRPRRWSSLAEAADRLLDAIAG